MQVRYYFHINSKLLSSSPLRPFFLYSKETNMPFVAPRCTVLVANLTIYSVSDLLASLTDITSDPAQINLVKEIHNRSTLAALGHTVESIKLPLEKRDRKRKRGGKVGGLGDKSGDDHADGGQGCGDESAQEGHARDEPQGQISENCGQRGEIGAPDINARGVTGGAEYIISAISPPATTPESRSGGPPAPATRGSRIRKAKSRPEPQETTSGE